MINNIFKVCKNNFHVFFTFSGKLSDLRKVTGWKKKKLNHFQSFLNLWSHLLLKIWASMSSFNFFVGLARLEMMLITLLTSTAHSEVSLKPEAR